MHPWVRHTDAHTHSHVYMCTCTHRTQVHTRTRTHAGLSLTLGDSTPRSEVAAHAGEWRPRESPQGRGKLRPSHPEPGRQAPSAGRCGRAWRPSEARNWRITLPRAARWRSGADRRLGSRSRPSPPGRSAFSSPRCDPGRRGPRAHAGHSGSGASLEKDSLLLPETLGGGARLVWGTEPPSGDPPPSAPAGCHARAPLR